MKSFLNISVEYDKCRYVIIPVPYDSTSTLIPGTRFGPESIISVSPGLEEFDMDYGIFIPDIWTEREEEMPAEPYKMTEIVKMKVIKELNNKKIPVILGGEHTISFGSITALLEFYNDLIVVSFDAHYDLRDEYSGFKLSHATVMRRVIEKAPVCFIGQRVISKEEKDFINTCRNFIQDFRKISNKNIYISFDLDAFDPSVCPSVGNPEMDGLKWKETIEIIEFLCSRNNVVGFDVVELQPVGNPLYGSYTAASLVKKIILNIERRKLNGKP
uniref:Agmatinase n=1 Tax=candidate division WOR-3 bacterium TaxID=2052148 RepID=A0A7C4U7C2_UNCW3